MVAGNNTNAVIMIPDDRPRLVEIMRCRRTFTVMIVNKQGETTTMNVIIISFVHCDDDENNDKKDDNK